LKLSADIPQLATGDPSGRFILSNNGGGIIDTNGFNTTIDRVLIDSNPVSSSARSPRPERERSFYLTPTPTPAPPSVTGGTLDGHRQHRHQHHHGLFHRHLAGTGTTGSVTSSPAARSRRGRKPRHARHRAAHARSRQLRHLPVRRIRRPRGRHGSAGPRRNHHAHRHRRRALSGSHTIFTHTGTLSGTASLVPPHGFTASLDTSTPGIVKVTLNSNLYATWSRDHFTPAELADPAISGPNASPAKTV
jgi:hypothetical protein